MISKKLLDLIRIMARAVGGQVAIEAGFDAIWSSGLEVSTAHGVPDASILTMTEYLAAARTIAGPPTSIISTVAS